MWTNISDVMTLKLSILVKYIVMISVIIRKVKNFKKSVVFFPCQCGFMQKSGFMQLCGNLIKKGFVS